MAGEFQFPPAPQIGGDSFEVAEWLQKVSDHLHASGKPYGGDGVDEALRAFWEANPETKPARLQADREQRIQDKRDRAIQRRIETAQMKDPNWIFGEEDE